ncbi:MAG: 2-amino-4-hydroxy-6-hydroxymethyldihydropteridine diphosphokinase [Smithella sp.]|nr:2-amino-4-hydroxy-6-hydroxymethyldihydropteridine diphosphokinase [Smithella sp.]
MDSGIICFIGIGSNLGNSQKNCQRAVEFLSETKDIDLTSISSFYKTEPVGVKEQNDFTNAVVEIRTLLSADTLLCVLQDIEKRMGRERKEKGAPRIIDLDLLFYGQHVIRETNMIIPHPELHKRRFVLEPLCEIASYFIHPSYGISVRGLMDRLVDKKSVERIKK